ncbi:hypothetical protein GCM10011519_02760 [Marmoricola endophyticus]|uniref:DUF3710 domain-containing protein n=1 Tax=Marmoricola endophyticus TaxID=2040280 RepID=A0A917EY12_9ACTN|nr:DUF3710 domain-containing protein [Marmoricola endophyticus]GGF32774.1 hypothetical protein GCM10011519_02760 [Marmoricola endophyticus]
MRFRRKPTDQPEGTGAETGTDEPTADPVEDVVPAGPWDDAEVDLRDDPAFADHVDLGGLLVAPPFDGADLRLQIDEQSGAVLAVLVAGEDGALELRAFSASRSDSLWPEVREAMQEEALAHEGQVSERTGAWGTELLCQMPVELPDGQSGIQPSRVIGVEKGRWLLRATLLGRPALEPEDAAQWEDAIRSTVVRRGTQAMPPGEPIPLALPADLEEQLRQQAEEAGDG